MSDAFDRIVQGTDINKYVDQIEEELQRIAREMGPAKTEAEADRNKERLSATLRKMASDLSKQTGVQGHYMFVYMLMTSVLTSAWVAFAIKRGILDMAKPFDERLRLEELLASLDIVLEDIIKRSVEHADMYGKK